MVEEHRNAAGRDEGAGRIGGDRDLAVAAFRLEPALDDRELALGVRAVGRFAQRNVHADTLVVAWVVEVDANADERLSGALLETRLRLDALPSPDVGAMRDLDSAERTLLDQLDPLVDRRVDEDVAGRRRVVVTVAGVAATNDPCQLRHVEERACLRDFPLDAYRTDARPAE